MKSKYILLGLFIIFSISLVSATECNFNAFVEDCTLNASTSYIMNGSTIFANDSNVNGVMSITGANTTLDCNGTLFDGNWSGGTENSRVFNPTGLNTTIKNCRIQDYRIGIQINSNQTTVDNVTIMNTDRGIQTQSGTIQDTTVINSIFNNITTGAFTITSNLLNANFSYNILSNLSSRGFFINGALNSTNVVLSHNNFTEYKGTIFTNQFKLDYNSQVFNNYCEAKNQTTGINRGCFQFSGSNSSNVYNNIIRYGGQGIQLSAGAWNISIHDNTIRENDKGININTANNIHLFNNTYINNTMDWDSYDIDLQIKNSTNILFEQENFSGYSSAGFVIMKSTYINGTNNKFSMIPMNQRSSYLAGDYQEPACAGSVVELYKTYLGDGEETASTLANITWISTYNSSNIVLTGNTYDSSVACILRTEGTTNLTQDITNSWYHKFSFPDDLKDPMEFWVSNNFNNISNYINSGTGQGITATLTSSYKNAAKDNSNLRPRGNYNVFKDYIRLYNINTSTNYNSTNFNSNNLLMFYDNYTLCGVSSDLSSNNGNISCFVPSKVNITILPDFNLTEGVSRQNSPLWFSSITSPSGKKNWHIANNVPDLTNVPIIVSISNDCSELSKITYTTDSGIVTTYTGQSAKNFCDNRVVSMDLDVEQATSSNELEMEFASNSLVSSILRIIIGLLALLVVVFTAGTGIYYLKNNFQRLDLQQIITFAVSVLIFTLLVIMLINYILEVI